MAMDMMHRFDDIPPELEREVERTAVASVVTHSAPMRVIPSIHRSQHPPENVPPPSPSPSDDQPSASAVPTSTSTLATASTSTAPTCVSAVVSKYPVEPDTATLVQKCHDFLKKLRSNPMVVQRLNNIGPVPEDIGLFTFYVASVRLSFPFSHWGTDAHRYRCARAHRSFRSTSTKRQSSCPSARPACDCAFSYTGSSSSSSTGGSKVLDASSCKFLLLLLLLLPRSWAVLSPSPDCYVRNASLLSLSLTDIRFVFSTHQLMLHVLAPLRSSLRIYT